MNTPKVAYPNTSRGAGAKAKDTIARVTSAKPAANYSRVTKKPISGLDAKFKKSYAKDPNPKIAKKKGLVYAP